MKNLTLGLHLGPGSRTPPEDAVARSRRAEELGYSYVWSAEAYGSDALTPLAWCGAMTQSIKLGTAITQMSARTATATAMAAMTLDHLSKGRFVLGLGVSGPQVVEGWYGRPFERPLQYTREYVNVIRQVVAREAPLTIDGSQISIPLPGSALGKPLKCTLHPLRPSLPIWLAAEGPRNVALAAEICDGWLPMLFSPRADRFYRECLNTGFEASAQPSKASSFEVSTTVSIVIGDDIEHCADKVRSSLAHYLGGMGARGANYHVDLLSRMGHEALALKVQDLYLEGDRAGAAAAIPLDVVESIALVGPVDKIRGDLDEWRDSCLTGINVDVPLDEMAQIAELVLGGQ